MVDHAAVAEKYRARADRVRQPSGTMISRDAKECLELAASDCELMAEIMEGLASTADMFDPPKPEL